MVKKKKGAPNPPAPTSSSDHDLDITASKSSRHFSMLEAAGNTQHNRAWDTNRNFRRSRINFVLETSPTLSEEPTPAETPIPTAINPSPTSPIQIPSAVEEGIAEEYQLHPSLQGPTVDSQALSDLEPTADAAQRSGMFSLSLGPTELSTPRDLPDSRRRRSSSVSSDSSAEVIVFSGRCSQTKSRTAEVETTRDLGIKITGVGENNLPPHRTISTGVTDTIDMESTNLRARSQGQQPANSQSRGFRSTRIVQAHHVANVQMGHWGKRPDDDVFGGYREPDDGQNAILADYIDHIYSTDEEDSVKGSDSRNADVNGVLSVDDREQDEVLTSTGPQNQSQRLADSLVGIDNHSSRNGFVGSHLAVQGTTRSTSSDSSDQDTIAHKPVPRATTSDQMTSHSKRNTRLPSETSSLDDHALFDVSNWPSRSTHSKAPGIARAMMEFALDDLSEEDAYGAFDVMDRNRPSIKARTKKGQHMQILCLSDSDLEASVYATWEADKVKKKVKKQKREALRAQGLLGSRNVEHLPSMDMRHQKDMSNPKITHEISQFLLSGRERLSLPPLDKKSRKFVHEIGTIFGLKTKSIGSGNQRYPTLFRTSRTKPFNENLMITTEQRLSRKGFRGLGASNKARLRPGQNREQRDRTAYRETAYRDGEVVGGAAPEIGSDNRGRAMLEKMGWSSGTALGAMNNKGMLVPISHVVKNTRVGLG